MQGMGEGWWKIFSGALLSIPIETWKMNIHLKLQEPPLNFKSCYFSEIRELNDIILNKILEPMTYYSCNHTQIYGLIKNFSMN